MDLHVKFDGHEIIVTPATDMMTAYRKAPDRPNLVLHPKLARAYSELARDKLKLRAHAFQAAVSKARELGWIV